MDNQATDLNNKKLFITEENRTQSNLITIHFDHEGLTYALTKCEGVSCSMLTNYPWFAVYDGKKRLSSNFCDKGTQSDYAFEFSRTKQGLLNADALLSIRKGKVRFDDVPSGPVPH
jgi:hypothetical protein